MKNFNQQKYVRQMLQEERAVQLISETRQNGGPGWVPREQLHADEVARESRIRETLGKTEDLLVVGLNPATGKFGVFAVAMPEPLLDFENGSDKAADPLDVANEIGPIHAGRIIMAHDVAAKVIDQIISGKVKHFEELSSMISPDAHRGTVMSILSQARKPPMNLDTLKGHLSLGGVEHMKRSLPCLETYRVIADVREIDDDGKPNGSLLFKIHEVLQTSANSPPILRRRSRISATLQTGADSKSLGLLHFAKLHRLMVTLELQMEYQIAERSWDVKVVEIVNEKELLSNDKPAQSVFNDW